MINCFLKSNQVKPKARISYRLFVMASDLLVKRMANKKIELIDLDKEKDAQVLQDISFTPSERFLRMFDLVEFCIAFSDTPKIPLNKRNCYVFTLKKKS